MRHEISAQRLEEQKAENGFIREQSYSGMSGGNLVEYFGQVGLFAIGLSGKIFACDP